MKNPKSLAADKKKKSAERKMLVDLEKDTFKYFTDHAHPVTGLIADTSLKDSPASISVTGMAITIYIAAIDNKLISKSNAIKRILTILRFFSKSHQGTEAHATGYKGFYYHFLEMDTGKRAWKSELSTIDTALFIAGALTASTYFSGNSKNEKEIRELADGLYRRINWQWALNKKNTLTHGYKPRSGFLKYRWDKEYSEAIILYVLALGSPTYPISEEGYKQWTSTFAVTKIYDIEYLYAGPLFIHQFSHMWIDFRGINDNFNKKAGFDYFENSKRATNVHREYAIDNPRNFDHYGKYCWGLTASDGPEQATIKINGRKIKFFGYEARGAPFGPDDGTVSPWAVVASLPFAPKIVLDTILYCVKKFDLDKKSLYGFEPSFNPTYPKKEQNLKTWACNYRFGLNLAPIIIMIENYQSECIWKIMKDCPYLVAGLIRAGFTGGWLQEKISG